MGEVERGEEAGWADGFARGADRPESLASALGWGFCRKGKREPRTVLLRAGLLGGVGIWRRCPHLGQATLSPAR